MIYKLRGWHSVLSGFCYVDKKYYSFSFKSIIFTVSNPKTSLTFIVQLLFYNMNSLFFWLSFLFYEIDFLNVSLETIIFSFTHTHTHINKQQTETENPFKQLSSKNYSPTISLIVPLSCIQWTSVSRLEPTRDTMEVECMIASAPCDITFICTIRILVGITFNARLHDIAKFNHQTTVKYISITILN